MTRTTFVIMICVAVSQLASCATQEEVPPCPSLISEYNNASVQRRLCLEEDGVVLYTWGRGADKPLREVLKTH